jgi:DNA polymerase-1
MNLQNVPGDQRDWFVPDPGLVLWEADGSQIEARITAYVAADENYKQGFIEGRDIHSENARALFKIPESKVRDPVEGTHYTYRDIGKRASHAINYMVGPGKLKDLMNEYVPDMKFSLNDSRRFIESFKTLRPGIHKWWINTIQHLKTNRVMRTPYGRQRVFLDRWGDQLHRAAVAFVPQSTAADHINAALARIELRLESIPEASVLLQVHDSVAGQCKPKDLEHVRNIVCEEMEKPIPKGFGYYWEDDLVIPADFASGPNWKSCK